MCVLRYTQEKRIDPRNTRVLQTHHSTVFNMATKIQLVKVNIMFAIHPIMRQIKMKMTNMKKLPHIMIELDRRITLEFNSIETGPFTRISLWERRGTTRLRYLSGCTLAVFGPLIYPGAINCFKTPNNGRYIL